MSKSKAIIVDIDGTLADCSHRVHHLQSTPKDWDAFYAGIIDDEPIEHIQHLMRYYSMPDKILVTGRPRRTFDDTVAWLLDYGISYQRLYMRPDGDYRADDILKREIYERNIQPYYDVLFALEDRDRCVRMYRSIGVPCLQVADGDF